MRVDIVKFDSKNFIPIPDDILQQLDYPQKFELSFEMGKIILNPSIRKGWDKAFKNMARNKDDKLLIDDSIDLDLENV